MSREIKLGAFAFIVLIVSIWGFTFLKGKNPLKKSFTFETVYTDVTSLSKSSKVFINGYAVGSVLDVELNEKNLKEMIISFNVEGDYKIPKNAIVEQKNDGIVGGKVLSITFDKQCTGIDCAQKGDRLQGKIVGLIGSMIGTGEVKEYASAIGTELSNVVSNIGSEDGEGAINKTILDLQKTMENMTKLTETTNRIMNQSAKSLTTTMKNMASITGNLAESNTQITAMLENFNQVSAQLKDANVGNTITSTTNTLEEAKKAMTQLQGTITNADNAMTNLNSLMTKASSGDGTLAMLLNDKELYNNLSSTTKNLSFLLQDFRLNPSRYVKVSVFGGKNKDPYVKPENDPAFEKN
ncbi:MAG: phospholipid/cholesterol/gamma-HCH transport system substrate-binding protein [Saprospiraceae bacterium]|jgi:phospholipid/cholesterol/gamma-HCH transport system substrate-binding protein